MFELRIITGLVICIILTGCPSQQVAEKKESPIGELAPTVESKERVEDIDDVSDITNAAVVNNIVDNSLESPPKDCTVCGMEESDVFESGNFSQRFDAVKQVSNYIMDNDQVKDMDQVSFSDKNLFCPKYDEMDAKNKKDFWATLMAVMSIYESNVRTNVSYDEGQTDSSLNGVVSRGLVQMSFNSARQSRYVANGCQLETPRQLHIPRYNLRCALAAMKTLVKKDGCIACGMKGGARYWSTLRKPYKVKNKNTGKWINIGKKTKVIADLKKYKPSCF